MKKTIIDQIIQCDTQGWQTLSVPFGQDVLDILVPAECARLRMRPDAHQAFSQSDIKQALNTPIGSDPLDDIIRAKGKPATELTVCVTVSDITRPIPYKGEHGILPPLLKIIEATGVLREHICIVIGNGMHRASTLEERITMYGQDVVDQYRILDHDCEDLESQVLAAHTSRGTEVHLNEVFYNADVKIVTGLVESHFMAGASGGRKGVCPALVNTRTLHQFHGVDFLEDPNATNLVLEGNPCHQEALEVARSVGVDFLVNVTVDHELKLSGIFAGHLEAAHEAAVKGMKASVSIPIDEPYDIVITHGAYVGRNHYQCGKAAVCAMPAVKADGFILLSANNFDVEPVGGTEYRTLLHLLKILGPDRFVSILRHPDWVFTKDQWQPQMWAKPLRWVGSEGLIYCAPQVTPHDCEIVPGFTGYDMISSDATFASDKDKARTMIQNAVKYAVSHAKWADRIPTIAFVEDGPYSIPIRNTRRS